MFDLRHPVIVVVGPTSSGKTDVAQILAEHLKGEVLSADSMQIYRGMDIGTGKISQEEQKVSHHGLDLIDPGEPFSAALFQAYARNVCIDMDSRDITTILCGGTGFYVRAVIDDYQFPAGEQKDNPLREQYALYAEEQGSQALWDLLNKRDKNSAQEIHPNNVRRVIRALELLEEGTSYAHQKEALQVLPEYFPTLQFGLQVDPTILADRINRRVDAMIENGLIEEVRGLLTQGFREGLTAPQAIGYKEIVAALDGLYSMENAIEEIKLATRRYAKRQRTWFRRDQRIHWINADDGDTNRISREILNCVSEDAAFVNR